MTETTPSSQPVRLDKNFATDPQLAAIESEWLGSTRKRVVVGLAVVWCLWQLWFAVTIPPAPVLFRSVHLAFAFAIAYLMFPGFQRVRPAWLRGILDMVLAAVAVWPMVHLMVNFVRPDVLRLIRPEQIDVVAGLTIFAIVILVNWRVGGPPLAITAALFLAYMFYGSSLPSPWGHSGTYSVDQIVSSLYLKLDTGILGVATSAAANLIFPVLFFGSILIAYGAGDFLSDLTTAALGRLRGAPAKIAVVASAGFATVTGTGPANVASTGVFTIPLMKRAGYSPHFAASVEATSSIGGQVMPPIMGASAFVMADLLGLPYSTIVAHAFVPAALYFLALFLVVDFRSARLGLTGVADTSGLSSGAILRQGWHFLPPIVWLLISLVALQRSVGRSAVEGAVVLVVIDAARRLAKKQKLEPSRLLLACVDTAKAAAFVGAAVAAVMIVIATLGLTGVGLRLSSILVSLAGGELFPLLVLTAIASIILGTGLPVVATYLVLALITAPAIISLGVPALAAHLFVFYLGVLADLSPPTALAPTLAAGIAGANLWKTMMTSMALGIFGFLLPFMFIYSPELMLLGDWANVTGILILASAVLAVVSFAGALEGYLFTGTPLWSRILLFVVAVLLVAPGMVTNIAGLGLGIALMVYQRRLSKRVLAPTLATSG